LNVFFSLTVSLRALNVGYFDVSSVAHRGTSDQRADVTNRDGMPSGSSLGTRSTTIGTCWVGEMFQLGGIATSSTSSASKYCPSSSPLFVFA
jgi:hypothetical protein